MLPEVKTAAVAIDAMEERHWDGVRAIYQAGIDTGDATFASSPVVRRNAWQRDHFNEFSVVATEDKRVIGWASFAPVSGRCVYLAMSAVVAPFIGFAEEATCTAVAEIEGLGKVGVDFVFESTLSGGTYARRLKLRRPARYRVEVVYLMLKSPQLALRRVAERFTRADTTCLAPTSYGDRCEAGKPLK